MFSRGPVPRTKVAGVVGVDPVSDRLHAARSSQRIDLREKLVLAVVAAVRAVRDIQRIIELVRLDEFVADCSCGDEFLHLLMIVTRKTGGERRDGNGALAYRAMRRPGEICRICAAG